MNVHERSRGDRQKPGQSIRAERDALQRDRLRAVALAIDGRETLEIAETLGRSRAFVQRWAYAYRDGGLKAIRGGTASGRRSALRGPQRRHILEDEFGVVHSLNAVYTILARGGH